MEPLLWLFRLPPASLPTINNPNAGKKYASPTKQIHFLKRNKSKRGRARLPWGGLGQSITHALDLPPLADTCFQHSRIFQPSTRSLNGGWRDFLKGSVHSFFRRAAVQLLMMATESGWGIVAFEGWGWGWSSLERCGNIWSAAPCILFQSLLPQHASAASSSRLLHTMQLWCIPGCLAARSTDLHLKSDALLYFALRLYESQQYISTLHYDHI